MNTNLQIVASWWKACLIASAESGRSEVEHTHPSSHYRVHANERR
jgi:hypothetical protein